MFNIIASILMIIVSVYYVLKILRMFTTPGLVREITKEVVNGIDAIIELLEDD